VRPVEHFYRVRFLDENALRRWADSVMEFALSPQGMAAEASDPRAVVFVPLMPKRNGTVFAYVSEGARGLAAQLASGVELDETPVPLRELPVGLHLLYGTGVDAAAYERRTRLSAHS
jgi:hypothetical protein